MSTFCFVDVSFCRRFGLSTFWFVDASVCRRIGLSTFWFVDVSVCRRFGLSTFWFVDDSVCRPFGLSTFWLSTFRFVDVLTSNLEIHSMTYMYCCPLNHPVTIYLKKWVHNTNNTANCKLHYNDVIIVVIASQITNLRLFSQPFIQTQVKGNIKAPRYWPLCGGFPGDRWIPRTYGQ